MYRGQQLVLFGRYSQGGAAEVILEAKLTGEDREWRASFTFPDESHDFPEIERLWAMRRIVGLERLTDAGLLEAGEAADGIRDLAVAHQLVTDETAMLVLDDAAFTRHGIERKNSERVAREQSAQSQRHAQPVQSHRVDNTKPMFDQPSPSFGGGAIHPAAAVVIVFFAGISAWRLRRIGLIR